MVQQLNKRERRAWEAEFPATLNGYRIRIALDRENQESHLRREGVIRYLAIEARLRATDKLAEGVPG